jgi:uncharacterized membrane protein YphA (DoxX/SURF4 family)
MNNFNATSIATAIVALITTVVLFVWSHLDVKSRPYSWLAAVWTLMIFLIFLILWVMSLDDYQPYDIQFMSNAVPGVILGSLVCLLVVGANEIMIHTRGGDHGQRS